MSAIERIRAGAGERADGMIAVANEDNALRYSIVLVVMKRLLVVCIEGC